MLKWESQGELLPVRLESNRRLVEVAAGATAGGFTEQEESTGWNRVHPAAGPDAAIILGTGVILQIHIAERG